MTGSLIEQTVQSPLLRIDELARQVGLPSRTIRFYNTQGLLPAPIMRGRVAYYSQEHALVLGLIRELKERQHLSLDVIKQLLEIRAEQGDVQMNLALKQRLLRTLTAGRQQVRLSWEEFLRQTGSSVERVEELIGQGLLFPVEVKGEQVFTGDDVLLLDLYGRLEKSGVTLALPALIRFQLRQLVRSEVAACEQYLLPQWEEEGLGVEQQAEQFEQLLTLTDTLISIMHRKLLYANP